jgi:hypothetical protein
MGQCGSTTPLPPSNDFGLLTPSRLHTIPKQALFIQQSLRGQALGLLVMLDFIHYWTSIYILLTCVLHVTLLASAMRVLILRWASHLDAFSGYPLRT